MVLKELSDREGARRLLLKCLSLTPMLWSAWLELAKLMDDRKMVSQQSIDEGRKWEFHFILLLAVQSGAPQSLASRFLLCGGIPGITSDAGCALLLHQPQSRGLLKEPLHQLTTCHGALPSQE